MTAESADIRAEVVRRLRGDRLPHPPEVEYEQCRDPGCNKHGDDLNGFCRPCARERQRTGKWETIPIEEAERSSNE